MDRMALVPLKSTVSSSMSASIFTGECKFGTGCKRSHDFSNSGEPGKLEKLGMRPELVSKLPSIYRNAHDIKRQEPASIRCHLYPQSQGTSGKALGWAPGFQLAAKWNV